MPRWNQALTVRYPITKLYQFFKNNGSTELLAVSQNKLQKVASVSLTPVTGTLTSDNIKMLTYKNRSIEDRVLIADGGKLKQYNGTSVTEVTPREPNTDEQTSPGLNDLSVLTNFRTFAMKKDRIFAAAHPTVKNRVHFSYFDPYLGYAVFDYFPSAYFFDVAVEDNDEIVELKVFRDALIILCKRSIWALYGDGASLMDYELVKINVPKGCVSPGSVQEVGNNLFYLADDHIYSLFSTERNFVSAQIMSAPIQPILKSVGLSDKEKAASIFFDNKYYLSFPSGLTLVYDVTIEAWTKYTNIPATSYLVVNGELHFSTNDGYIHKFDENKYSDDGYPIPFVMKTKILDFGMPIQEKKLRRMWLLQKQWAGYESSFDLHALVDQFAQVRLTDLGVDTGEGIGARWDSSSWDKAVWDFSETTQHELKLRNKGKSIQLQVSNCNVDEPLTILGMVFEYKAKKP